MSDVRGNHLFCFGFGYSCEFLARLLKEQGWGKVTGTTRDPEKKTEMRKRGIGSYLFNDDKPLADPQHFMHDVTHVLISTPPDDAGDPVFHLHADAILELPFLKWVGYLSSTSVYGDRHGDWVDETAVPQPRSQRGSRRLRAEEQWLSLYRYDGLPVHIFRLAGIYGPGRSVLDSVRAGIGRRIDKPDHVFNRIHVEDIAQILAASCDNPKPGAIYNIGDDYPAPSHEVISYACELLGQDIPKLVPFEEAHLPPMARSFYLDNKRLRNNRVKEELGLNLLYPDYKSGLKACLKAEQEVALPEISRNLG